MAGMGFVGAGGAAGTYEGLRDWMQGRRQKVVQGQRDEDRLREQALQNQALATEAADREYDIARQRTIDTRTATKEAQAEAARQALLDGIDRITDERVTPVHKLMARFDAQQGRVSPLIEEALKTVKPQYDIAPNGELINLNDPKNLGRTFTAPVKPNYDIAPSGELVDVNDPKNLGRNFAAQVRAPQAADDIIGVETTGPDGKPVKQYMRESQAVAHGPFAQAPKGKGAAQATGQQRKVLGYYNRANDAIALVEELEPQVGKGGILEQVQLEYAPNMLQTGPQQRYRQGQRAFTEARLRRESGATIKTDEYEGDAKTYFRQPGDSERTVRQKKLARQTLMRGWKFEAGDAYEEFYGVPNDPPPPVKLRAPTGEIREFPLTDTREIHKFIRLGAEVVED